MKIINYAGTNFYVDKIQYDEKEKLLRKIVVEYNQQPNSKPDSWEENVFTTIQYGGYKNNFEYFELARIPLDLVAVINDKVQEVIYQENLNELGTFYISQMWCNAYKNGQYQHMHKHSNNNNCFFSGVYYISFDNDEHSSTRFYNPSFEVDFDKVKEHKMFMFQPEVKEDTLIIFPSDVGHDVLAQYSSKLRITISFNVACIFNEQL